MRNIHENKYMLNAEEKIKEGFEGKKNDSIIY